MKSSGEKKFLALLKQKKKFEEIANGRMGEIRNWSKEIDFNNLIYCFKGKSSSRDFINFEDPLAL